MKPKSQVVDQGDLYRSRLDQILNRKHPLFVLAGEIDWSAFTAEFGSLYVEKMGRPALPIRLLVGLHYLKHAFNVSDEDVVVQFVENPYWQFFCGFEYFQHRLPLDPTTLVKWRKRIGPKGMEKLLAETLATAKRQGQLTAQHMERVNVDTTVQEKAIAFPTDARLYFKARRLLVRLARRRRIALRQSYERVGKRAFLMQSRYSHARQMKRARRELKRLRTQLGCVIRDLRRKCPQPDQTLATMLVRAERIYRQQRSESNKLYSLYAPEVECIAKGKAHKKYEFGCKVSLVSTSHDNWIVGVQALHGNPYDGHTLKGALEQSERLTGWRAEHAYCDRGYKGAPKHLGDTAIHLASQKKRNVTRKEWRWFKRRSAIEPIIGHTKSDHRMDRNYLKGEDGDKINALLAGCGFNLRKLLRMLPLSRFKEPMVLLETLWSALLGCFMPKWQPA